MFEDMTFDVIINRMLDRISDDLDKREGSIIYDALAPAAAELQQLYMNLDLAMQETFAATATRTGLILRAAEIGLLPNDATYAVRLGIFTPSDLEVPIGSRFNLDDLNYTVTKKVGDGEYQLTCETAGEAGNYDTGTLVPIDYIDGLKTAVLSDVLIVGEEEESTEDFRTRYFSAINNEVTEGNVAQYVTWCDAYQGIGRCKIFPLWNGANTVKVSILNSDNGIASQTLIDEFQEYLDPDSEGKGNGVAPIGAMVTVSTATAKTIYVSASVVLKSGYSGTADLDQAVTDYLSGLAYTGTTVSYLSVASALLNCDSVDRISSLKVNDGTADIELADEEIPIFGTGTWEVAG